MSGDLVIQMAQEALRMVLLISAPMLGLGLLVGLAVSVFQATTSIQEQTLTFVPKIVAVFLTLMLLGGWMLDKMADFMTKLWNNFSLYIG